MPRDRGAAQCRLLSSHFDQRSGSLGDSSLYWACSQETKQGPAEQHGARGTKGQAAVCLCSGLGPPGEELSSQPRFSWWEGHPVMSLSYVLPLRASRGPLLSVLHSRIHWACDGGRQRLGQEHRREPEDALDEACFRDIPPVPRTHRVPGDKGLPIRGPLSATDHSHSRNLLLSCGITQDRTIQNIPSLNV